MSNSKKAPFSLTVLSLALMGISTSSLTAAVAISSLDTEVKFDFTDFTGSGFSPMPTAGQLDSNNWSVSGLSDGDVNFGGTGTSGDFARGNSTGGETTGGVYAFDVGSGNIALGVQPIGADFTPGDFTLRLENLTGATVSEIAIAYDLFVLNNEDRANSLNFSYATGSGSYSSIAALDYTSTEAADTPASWINTPKATIISSLALLPNDYLYLKWTGDDVSGSDSRDEFAIDNISITASAVPEISSTLMGMVVLAGFFYRGRRS